MNNEQEYIYEIGDDEEKEEVNLAGYQVTKAELFAHSREPSVTIWQNKIKFNMACLKRFPKVTHVLILINQDQKRLIVKPCSPDTPDSLRWATWSLSAAYITDIGYNYLSCTTEAFRQQKTAIDTLTINHRVCFDIRFCLWLLLLLI